MKKNMLYIFILFFLTIVLFGCKTEKYTISFNVNGGSTVESITQVYKTYVTKPIDPTKEGYTFGGWFKDNALAEEYTFSTMPSQNITLFAKWNINQYTISFDSITQDYNTPVTQPTDPIKEGYTFGGWYKDRALTEEYIFTTMPSQNITLYSKWNINQYTISFDSNGGSLINSITQDYHTPVTKPTYPTKEGYTFGGWYIDSGLTQLYTFSTMPSQNVTLYAKWNINQYTISFDSNEGSLIDPITQDYHTPVTKPTDPIKEGYTFEGWYQDSGLTEAFTFSTVPSKNITLFAKWIINHYTINFDSNEGSLIDPVTQDYHTPVSKPIDPTKEGYTFGGWYQDSGLTELYSFSTMPSHNITLYAKWNINQYTINFDSNGGSLINSITQDYNTMIVQPTDPTKEVYTFGGWYQNTGLTEAFTFSTMPSHNITLYAKWNINQYTISFDSNGGILIDPITQDYNSLVTQPTDPTKEGYTFGGWYQDIALTELYIFSTMLSYNITLYAKWNINQYTISFDSNGGNLIDPITLDYYTPITQPTEPIQEGYTFGGWYKDSGLTEAFTFSTMPSQNITLYADWGTDNVLYELSGDYAIIKSCIVDSSEVILLRKVNIDGITVDVTQIGNNAFYGCSSLTSITIPSSVTSIGNYAFYGCSGLISITIPNSVTSIGAAAFSLCGSLTSFNIPNSVTSIGEAAFSDCSSLTRIFIPISVTSIRFGAFQYCINLKIFCEALSTPSGWHPSWNLNNSPVYWGFRFSDYVEVYE